MPLPYPSSIPHLRIRSGMYKRRMHMKVFWIVANICISVSSWRAGTLFCLSLNFFHHVGLLDRKVNVMTFWKCLTCPLMVSVMKRSKVIGVLVC